MEMRVLGTTGLQVSAFCLGAGMFGRFGNSDHADCERIVHAALDAGINFVDTSDVYSFGESEEIVGKALRGRRDQVILATKFGLPTSDKPNRGGGSRHWILREVENSLRRLGTDHIDLYQMHRPDPTTDLDVTLGALSDLVRQGKVRAIGCSTFPADMIVESRWLAERGGHEPFRTEQPPYSLFARRIEADVLPTCERYGLGVLVWSPLAQGWLSGKYRRGTRAEDTRRGQLQPQLFDETAPDTLRKYDAIERLTQLADDSGISLMHMALAFATHHPAVTSAIIGPRTLPQLTGLLEAADRVLDDTLLDAIDEIVPPGANLSHEDDGYTPPALLDPARRRRARSAPAATAVAGRTDKLREMFGSDDDQ